MVIRSIIVGGFVALLAGSLLSACQIKPTASTAAPADHTLWDSLLQAHVNAAGVVDYLGFQADSLRLRTYLRHLAQHHPHPGWTREQQLAYWINAYNAFTVELVCRHYPIASIKAIRPGIPFVNSVWDLKFIHLSGRDYDLNNIEHGILRRQFQEPRIHFVLNCASQSCPVLHYRAYTAEGLAAQLEEATQRFLGDPQRNKLQAEQWSLSRLFFWYGGDFKGQGGVKAFVARHTALSPPSGPLRYLDYDWSINDH